MQQLDVVVIGAGVVGLAVARAFALTGREVVALEAATEFGTQASSRNSEVIHAGIYYPGGSLKARACVAGREMLYAYCRERQIAHRRIGKLLVAAHPGEVGALEACCERARANGVDDLRWLDEREWRELEPALEVCAAVLSPSTGIVDSHGLMRAFLGDLERAGGVLVYASPVTGGDCGTALPVVRVGGISDTSIRCRTLVNCAGALAPALALRLGMPRSAVPNAFFARGRYFSLGGASPFTHLVYPMPEAGGLGIHVTLDMAGQARFGPDVQWVDGIDHHFDSSCERQFVEAIARYFPGISQRALQPAYCGIRAKISGPGEPAADFTIVRHPAAGLVNLFGIESPGLTAAMALAALVVQGAGS